MNHAVINKDGKVVNVVWWEGAPWSPPEGHVAIRSDVMGIGDIYNHATGEVTKPHGDVYHKDTKYEDYRDGKAVLRKISVDATIDVAVTEQPRE